MRWPKDPSGKGHPKTNRIYRILRRLSRSIVSIWFREINIVDDENIPPEGGVIFISWHPSGLIDPMLMHASLPGKLSMIAKHTLFKVPILGRLIRGAGAVPIERSQDSTDQQGSKTRNQQQLDSVASVVADGGRLIAPVGLGQKQQLILYRRDRDSIEETPLDTAFFVPALAGLQ